MSNKTNYDIASIDRDRQQIVDAGGIDAYLENFFNRHEGDKPKGYYNKDAYKLGVLKSMLSRILKIEP